MRLRKSEKESIVKAIKSIDPESKIYLFGSRTNDSLKGGDIDLLIVTDKLTYNDKLAIKKRLFSEIEEQKIDIIISQSGDEPFVKMIFDQAVKL